MKILVIDVGATHIKVVVSGEGRQRELASAATLRAPQLVEAVLRATADWSYDVVSIGLPGPVVHGRIVDEPADLGSGWVGFDFAQAFGRPVKLLGHDDAVFAAGAALWRDAGDLQRAQPARSEVVFLLDVDNTLLDNDRIIAELAAYLQREIGRESSAHYFELFEQLRSELGYADYLGALQRFRVAYPREPGLLAVSSFIVNYPFANRLFPSALDVIEHLGRLGPTVILTDGDVVFQPRKIDCSGLFAAVSGRVLISIHKEHDLDYVAECFPADHYVLVDDKVRILSAIKQQWGARVTTVFPRQGHYALDPCVADYPTPDVTVERIGELLAYDPKTLLRTAAG